MSDQTIINVNPKPGKVQAIEIILLVSGILNILTGVSLVCGALVSIIGVLCLPVVALPLVLGVYEVVYASKLLSGKPVSHQNLKTIAIFELITIVYCNVPSLVAGILNLVFLDEQPVKEYLS
jgi:uncharacterized membrane protein